MSCNGCRVLRKGCSDACILRPCIQWIDSAEAQAHAITFVAKFFGRTGLMSFISAVPEAQRPALFQSLLFEAAGRTVNPVSGAVGLLWSENWHLCQEAVETVLRGGALKQIDETLGGSDMSKLQDHGLNSRFVRPCRFSDAPAAEITHLADLDLGLTQGFHCEKGIPLCEKRRLGSPSMNSEESMTTTCEDQSADEIKLLNLFN